MGRDSAFAIAYLSSMFMMCHVKHEIYSKDQLNDPNYAIQILAFEHIPYVLFGTYEMIEYPQNVAWYKKFSSKTFLIDKAIYVANMQLNIPASFESMIIPALIGGLSNRIFRSLFRRD